MPILEITSPHYTVECDECGERAGSEDYWVLYESRAEAERETVEGWGWRLADGKVTCSVCVDEEAIAASSPPESPQGEEG